MSSPVHTFVGYVLHTRDQFAVTPRELLACCVTRFFWKTFCFLKGFLYLKILLPVLFAEVLKGCISKDMQKNRNLYMPQHI